MKKLVITLPIICALASTAIANESVYLVKFNNKEDKCYAVVSSKEAGEEISVAPYSIWHTSDMGIKLHPGKEGIKIKFYKNSNKSTACSPKTGFNNTGIKIKEHYSCGNHCIVVYVDNFSVPYNLGNAYSSSKNIYEISTKIDPNKSLKIPLVTGIH